jgi:Tol biopolymer transport system component
MKKKKNEAKANWFFRSVVVGAILVAAFLGRFAYVNRNSLNTRVERSVESSNSSQRVEVIYRFANYRDDLYTETLYRADLTRGLSSVWHEFEAVGIDRGWMQLSPDGRYLAYSAEPDGNPERTFNNDIYVVDFETGHIDNITQSPDINDSVPQWSPDGVWLVYNNDVGNDMDIFITNYHGNRFPMNLTDNAPNVDAQAMWSFDGTELAILSSRPYQSNQWGIDVWHAFDGTATGEIPSLADYSNWDISRIVDDVIYIVDVQWSPDGQWLAYKTNQPDGVWVAAADGASEPVMVSQLTSLTNHFSWSPDSQWIVYSAGGNGNYRSELHATNIYTMQVENLTQSTTDDQYPVWLSDGHIVFVRDYALYSMDFETGELVQLAEKPSSGFVEIIGWQYAE